MKIKYRETALAALAAGAVLLAGCQEEAAVADRDSLTFDVRIETVGANDVTALVSHNGTEDVTYYAFCYRDFTQGEPMAIENAVAALKESGAAPSEVLTSGSSASVKCTGLQSSAMYRLVVCGLDEDYNVYGTPASVYFNTVEGSVIYEPNPDWIVTYQGKQAASDNSGYGDVIQVTSYGNEDGYFAAVVPAADYQTKGIAACAEEVIAEREAYFAEQEEAGWIVDRSEYVYYTTAAYILETGDEGEYVGLAIGVDENFKATGLYAASEPFTPEEVEYSVAYGRWLGDWRISGTYEDENGEDLPISYDITISYLVPDQAYIIYGYQNGLNGVELPGVQASFDPRRCLIFTVFLCNEDIRQQPHLYGWRLYDSHGDAGWCQFGYRHCQRWSQPGGRNSVQDYRNAVYRVHRQPDLQCDSIHPGPSVPVHDDKEKLTE